MLLLIIVGTAVCAAIGGYIAKVVTDKNGTPAEITPKEFVVGVALITLFVSPLTGYGLYRLAQNNRVQYKEFLNGREVATVATPIKCTRDGPCRWEYDCDPYTVQVPYQDCSGSGKDRTCTTRYRTETRYHSCPYCDTEWNYEISTTLGSYTIDTHRLPDNPQAHRWRKGTKVPAHVIERAGVGVPQFWSAAARRIESGLPGPVTAVNTYDNYLLASQTSLLREWSDQVTEFSERNLLPEISREVYSYYFADKAHFVGWSPFDAKRWQERVGDLNAVLGPQLNGDLRVVVVRDSAGTLNADQYLFALKAYWQDEQRFGRGALPKNTVLMVLGTKDGERVSWARATTGMPMGNEAIGVAAQHRLKGVLLDPDSIIGTTHYEVVGGATSVVHGNGAAESLLFGLENPDTRFKRVSMSGRDGSPGFLYLKGEIRPTRTALFWVFVGTFAASIPVWVAMLLIGERDCGWRHPYGYGGALGAHLQNYPGIRRGGRRFPGDR